MLSQQAEEAKLARNPILDKKFEIDGDLSREAEYSNSIFRNNKRSEKITHHPKSVLQVGTASNNTSVTTEQNPIKNTHTSSKKWNFSLNDGCNKCSYDGRVINVVVGTLVIAFVCSTIANDAFYRDYTDPGVRSKVWSHVGFGMLTGLFTTFATAKIGVKKRPKGEDYEDYSLNSFVSDLLRALLVSSVTATFALSRAPMHGGRRDATTLAASGNSAAPIGVMNTRPSGSSARAATNVPNPTPTPVGVAQNTNSFPAAFVPASNGPAPASFSPLPSSPPQKSSYGILDLTSYDHDWGKLGLAILLLLVLAVGVLPKTYTTLRTLRALRGKGKGKNIVKISKTALARFAMNVSVVGAITFGMETLACVVSGEPIGLARIVTNTTIATVLQLALQYHALYREENISQESVPLVVQQVSSTGKGNENCEQKLKDLNQRLQENFNRISDDNLKMHWQLINENEELKKQIQEFQPTVMGIPVSHSTPIVSPLTEGSN